MKTICSHMQRFDHPSRFGRDKCLAKIGLYDPQEGLLGVWAIGLSTSMATKRLNKLRPVLIDMDECDDGLVGVFHEKDLDLVCEVVGVKKRQRWSTDRRQATAQRMRRRTSNARFFEGNPNSTRHFSAQKRRFPLSCLLPQRARHRRNFASVMAWSSGVRNAPRAQITKIVNDEVRMVER